MKAKFNSLFKAFLLLLFAAWAWALWGAQTATNLPPARSTNAPSQLVQDVEHWGEHPLSFGLNNVPFLRSTTLLGQPLWKYGASLIYILLAFFAAKVVDWATRNPLRRLGTTGERRAEEVPLMLRGPIKIVVFVILLHLGLNLFAWPPMLRVYLSRGLIVIVAVSLTYLVIKILDLVLERWTRRHQQQTNEQFNQQLLWVLRISLNIFVIVVAVLVTAQNLEINITAAIASLSIGGLAVGLAAQDTLGNLFGAVALFVDKPFRIGDQIKLDAAEGTVEAIGLRSTRVRNPDGYLIAVPNKTMGNAAITNLSQRSSIRTTLNLVLARGLPAEKVKRALELLEEIYRGHPMTRDVWISFNQFAGGNLNVEIVHWWKGTDTQQHLAGMQELNLKVKERFDAEGITMA
jgi:MscS family membrane protein